MSAEEKVRDALGRLTIVFSQLDNELKHSIWILDGGSEEPRRFLSRMDRYGFRQLAERWLNSHPHRQMSSVPGILKRRLKKANDRRNELIHAWWWPYDGGVQRSWFDRSVNRIRNDEPDPVEIHAAADEIEELRKSLAYHMMELGPGLRRS